MDKSVAIVQIAAKSKSLTNQHRFYRYPFFHFILQTVLNFNQLMSTKKQIFSLCKLYSVFKQIPEESLDKTNVECITTFSTFHSPTTELFELAKDPTKSLLHSKCFIFAIQSYSKDIFSRKKFAFPKKEIESPLDSLGEFLKAFDQANKLSQIPLHKPKF